MTSSNICLKIVGLFILTACGGGTSALDANGIPTSIVQDGVRGRWRLLSDDNNMLGVGLSNPMMAQNTGYPSGYPNGYPNGYANNFPNGYQNQTSSSTSAIFYIESDRVTYELDCPNYTNGINNNNYNNYPGVNGYNGINASNTANLPLIRSVINVNSNIDGSRLNLTETRSSGVSATDPSGSCVSHLDSNQFDFTLSDANDLILRDVRTGSTLRFTRN